MDLTRPSELKPFLAAHGLHLSKRFGQNFLIDRNHLMRVVETADVRPDDLLFEIGPGVGTLTVELAQRAAKVLSVELDRGVLPALRETTAPYSNVEIVEGDALRLDLPTFLPERWGVPSENALGKVAANIPYNITSPILVLLLENRRFFRSVTLMVQREVADRLRAKPGSDDYGALSVFVQFHAAVSVAGIVPRRAFFPPPKVDSAVIHLVPYATPPVETPDPDLFLLISRAAFGQRRKTLQNALTNAGTLPFDRERILAALAASGVDGQRRGETLSLEEFAAISRVLYALKTAVH
ncbi:MAG: 16S rRNA (adenine(1518)-N(6)/adenine(1519)-N(6))-dimethyltransferase RsmA [Capsulimonadales bacterium]|nr:16S rRNA (adenine(1518)-N(6)/adenine(1519)-N(6))-dimethyltransferase RsmA [Capsulimonadales bacterium]